MTGWRILDASNLEGSLSSRRGLLVITPEDARPTVVAAVDIATVLIGPHVTVHAGALHRIHDAGGVALFTDWRGVPEASSYPWWTHTRVAARQRAQIAMSLPQRKSTWARIVRAKIRGQAAVLATHGKIKAAEKLHEIARRVRSGDPSNEEAHAARVYWRQLNLEPGFRRTPQARSGANALLDYGYGVLRGHGIRAVLAAGLLPAIGLHHTNRSNAFNLVDDLIEPFRPAVDDAVAYLAATSTEDLDEPQTRRELVAACASTFTEAGATIPTCLQQLAQEVGQLAEHTTERVNVPAWAGPAR